MGIEAILLIFALAFVGITRGSYKNLFAIKMNHWWALVPVLIGHLAIEFVPIKQNQFDSVGISILLTTYVFLFGFLWANLNLKAMWIALLGASSNALVIALNLALLKLLSINLRLHLTYLVFWEILFLSILLQLQFQLAISFLRLD